MTHPYATAAYARSSAGDDETFRSETLGVWLRARPIPSTGYYDACGLYPFSCGLQPATQSDLENELRQRGLVSLVFVTDPLEDGLAWTDCLDVSRPYKTHHVVDLTHGPAPYSKHHRQEVRRARGRCETRRIDLRKHLGDWCRLYDHLIDRHNLGSAHRFSDLYFESLCADERFLAFGAFFDDRMISCHIWAHDGPRAYSHLAASDDEGYRCGAAYAVNDCSLKHFSGCRLIDLGGVADAGQSHGLEFFKSGFANCARVNKLCGVIADREVYKALNDGHTLKSRNPSFFPVYRSA